MDASNYEELIGQWFYTSNSCEFTNYRTYGIITGEGEGPFDWIGSILIEEEDESAYISHNFLMYNHELIISEITTQEQQTWMLLVMKGKA